MMLSLKLIFKFLQLIFSTAGRMHSAIQAPPTQTDLHAAFVRNLDLVRGQRHIPCLIAASLHLDCFLYYRPEARSKRLPTQMLELRAFISGSRMLT